MHLSKKKELLQKRIWRVRRKIVGTAERPRLCVSFSNKHTYAQIIDDEAGKTIVSATSLSKDVRGENLSANCDSAKRLGTLIGERAKAAGIGRVVFDRHGRQYHGSVKAFAEGAREAGLEF